VNTITVDIDGRERTAPRGTSLKELLRDREDVIAAVLNHHLVSLDTTVFHGVSVSTVTTDEPRGRTVLRNGAELAFQSLLKKHCPELEVEIGQSLLGGYFYQIDSPSGDDIDLSNVAYRLNEEMKRLVKQDLPFKRELLSLGEAIRLVDDPTASRARLLRSWPAPRIHVAGLNGCHDLQHGVLPPSTRYLEGVEVLEFSPGLVLRFGDCCEELAPGHGQLLMDCYHETRRWSEMIGARTVGELNTSTLEGRFERVVRLNEALHEKRISQIADQICENRQVKIVCIAGPSASGKSTFLKRLATQLGVNGKVPLTISLDDYYRERSGLENIDLESPEALDIALLNRHVEALLRGEVVQIPRFDFARQKPAARGTWRLASLAPRGILLLEGLHGLNPSVVHNMPDENVFRVFVSALTQIIIDEYNRVPTSKVRLLRRITRDRKFRGSTTEQVLEQWPKVQSGEKRYIFPFQDKVDCLFNSSLVYEAAVLKSFAWRYLLEVPREHPTQGEAFRLLKFLELFVPVLPDIVPDNSILQEFVRRLPPREER
jgi:uridine kinase